ncbi:MAG: hypothetical protein A3K03_04180 [Bdellovibrionales bacterium RIFOXYD1_FULL_44_7]|nr:MAG: hypothetical protein A3K03_04180 [Bdellovibrionales bacterium RIFOXYD1_FULL_44_7]
MNKRKFYVAQAIGKVTFFEIIRDKVLYNIVLCSFLLLAISFLAARLAVFKQDRVLLDFGLTALNLSCLMIAVFNGASMIGKEFERRTVLVALSRPISRLEFVLGKFAGLAAVITVNWLLLTVSFIIIMVATASVDLGNAIGFTFAAALILGLLQSFMVAAIAVFFSSFSTTSLSVIFTIGLYLIGTNISQLRWLASKTEFNEAGIAPLLNFFAAILPNFEHFNLGPKVTYNLPLTWSYLLATVTYGLVISSLAILLSGVLIQRKEA